MKTKIYVLGKIRNFIDGKEWQITIIASMVFLLIILILNIYFFFRINSEVDKTAGAETEFSTVVFERELFEKTLDNLRKKEQYFNQGLLAKPAISDPSL